MTASWLAQMNVDTYVVEHASADDLTETGPSPGDKPAAPPSDTIEPHALAALLDDPASGTVVLDFTTSANHVKAHIPGAHWVLRSRLAPAYDDLRALPDAKRYVVTCGSSALAAYAAPEVAALTGKPFEPFASRVLPGYRHPGRTAPPVED